MNSNNGGEPLQSGTAQNGAISGASAPTSATSRNATLPAATLPAKMSAGLRLIVGVKLVQGVALAGVGIGLLMLNRRSADVQVAHWSSRLQIDADTNSIRHFLRTLHGTSPSHWKHLGMAAFLYAAVTLTEGAGLWKQKEWAEILTIGVSASFVPLELYELARHFKFGTLGVLAINIGVVCYLVNILNNKRRAKIALEKTDRPAATQAENSRHTDSRHKETT